MARFSVNCAFTFQNFTRSAMEKKISKSPTLFGCDTFDKGSSIDKLAVIF